MSSPTKPNPYLANAMEEARMDIEQVLLNVDEGAWLSVHDVQVFKETGISISHCQVCTFGHSHIRHMDDDGMFKWIVFCPQDGHPAGQL